MNQKEDKKQIVADLKEKFEKAVSIVVVDYTGVNAKQTTNLRKQFRENGVEYVVSKNTLLKRAANEAGISGLDDSFAGVTAVAFCYDDAVKAASIVSKFVSNEKIMTIKSGLLEGEVLDVAKIEKLGSLPSKDVLLAQVASCFLAPLRNVAYALDAVRKKAEEEASA